MSPARFAISLCFGALALSTVAAPGQPMPPDRVSALRNLPLYFVENRGVFPDAVRFYVRGAGKTLFFTDDGVTFALRGKGRAWTVKLDLLHADSSVRPEGRRKCAAVFSHFRGPRGEWKTGMPSFAKIAYREAWPGIDLVYEADVNKLKYAFVLAPGADPTRIRLRYRGATELAVTNSGAMRVSTPAGDFEDEPPVAWQEANGARVAVEVEYTLADDGRFGFTLGDYDKTKPLILDPAVLVQCGYIGGASSDTGFDVAVDSQGNLYVAGATDSSEVTFPAKVGPGPTYNGGSLFGDAFIAKVNPQGTELVYCGYIGGRGWDHASGVAVDASGNAYVTGATGSFHTSFPVTVGPDLTWNGGSAFAGDAFVAKVNAQGTGLVYCGYIGGNNGEAGTDIAVDAAGHAYVAGYTLGPGSFPVTVGPDLTANGAGDAFVAKVNPGGTGLDYCGYIGGAAVDVAKGIAVDATGSAYVFGYTDSDEASFPAQVGPDLTYNGGGDTFVAKVDALGSALVYCGYIGGNRAGEDGYDIAVDASGNAYVTGRTTSDERSFPVKVGPDLTYNGGADAFVAKVNALGTSLVYCGYVGGSATEIGLGVAVDAAGRACLTGIAGSDETTFPVEAGPDLTYNGGDSDAFVAVVNAQGTRLVSCGYIGGSGRDEGHGIAVDVTGNAYVTGATSSTEADFPVRVGPDPTYNGGSSDAFVAKLAFTHLEGTGTPQPGGSIDLRLVATSDSRLSYQLASSFGTGPIPLDTRQVKLSVDGLLWISSSDLVRGVFVDYRGLIQQGTARAKLQLPAIPTLVGIEVHTAFVTLSETAPSGVESISNTFSFTIL